MDDNKYHELMRSLFDQRRAAEDKYLELRDAKSNGCCWGLPLRDVLIYDDSIMAAKAEIDRIDAEINQTMEAHHNK
jgi:hypothetical protein